MLPLTAPGLHSSADERRIRGLAGLALVLRLEICEISGNALGHTEPTFWKGYHWNQQFNPITVRLSPNLVYPLLRDNLTVCERLVQQFNAARLLGHEVAVSLMGTTGCELMLMLLFIACCWSIYE